MISKSILTPVRVSASIFVENFVVFEFVHGIALGILEISALDSCSESDVVGGEEGRKFDGFRNAGKRQNL